LYFLYEHNRNQQQKQQADKPPLSVDRPEGHIPALENIDDALPKNLCLSDAYSRVVKNEHKIDEKYKNVVIEGTSAYT